MKQHHGVPVPTCYNPNCGFIFWQNSKPAATLIIEDDTGRVLITERDIEPGTGKLDWPGGFLNEGEDPREAAAREAMEELGVVVDVMSHVGVHTDSYGNEDYKVLCLCYTATITEGTPKANEEIAAISWMQPQDIDRSQFAFASGPVFLDMWLQQRKET